MPTYEYRCKDCETEFEKNTALLRSQPTPGLSALQQSPHSKKDIRGCFVYNRIV